MLTPKKPDPSSKLPSAPDLFGYFMDFWLLAKFLERNPDFSEECHIFKNLTFYVWNQLIQQIIHVFTYVI